MDEPQRDAGEHGRFTEAIERRVVERAELGAGAAAAGNLAVEQIEQAAGEDQGAAQADGARAERHGGGDDDERAERGDDVGGDAGPDERPGDGPDRFEEGVPDRLGNHIHEPGKVMAAARRRKGEAKVKW